MQYRTFLLGLVLAAVLAVVPSALRTDHIGIGFVSAAAAQTENGVDISIFFDELEPQGRWLSTRHHGYVWVPANVAPEWRPYTHGEWVYTRHYGWLWVSDEPYGWAVYHYGRWGYDDDYGWFWVPGSQWAPAWVSWHYSDEYIGWAALPPSDRGYAFSLNVGAVSIGVGAWRFVPTRDFLDSNIDTHILAGGRNPELLQATRSAGSVRVVNNVVVNDVINVTNVEQVVNRKVIVHEVAAAEQPGPVTKSGEVVRAFQPSIANRQPKAAPKQAASADMLENKPAALKADAKAQGEGKAAKQPPVGAKDEPKDQSEPKQKVEPRDQSEPKQKSEPRDQSEPKQKAEPRDQSEPKQKAEPKDQSEPKQKAEPKDQSEPKQKAEPRDQSERNRRPGPRTSRSRSRRSNPRISPSQSRGLSRSS